MKIFKKIKNSICLNKKLFVFLLFLIITGLITGSIFSLLITSSDKRVVLDYLSSFIKNCQNGVLTSKHNLTNNLFFAFCECTMIWFIGYSVIGFFLILFLFFIKAFILGFSVGSILLNFKLKGLLISLIYVFPNQIFNLIIYMVLSYYALFISYKIIRSIRGIDNLNLKESSKNYFLILIISLVFVMISNLYSVYIIPWLIKSLV